MPSDRSIQRASFLSIGYSASARPGTILHTASGVGLGVTAIGGALETAAGIAALDSLTVATVSTEVVAMASRKLRAVGKIAEAAGDLVGLRKAPKSGGDWAKLSGQLLDATKGKGNFNIGSGTSKQADAMGKAWVGDGYKVASDGKTLVSKDGLRQYRPPSHKPDLGKTQANFEQRFAGQKTKQWQSNAHLDIVD